MSIINIDNLFNKINFNRSIEEKSLYNGQFINDRKIF